MFIHSLTLKNFRNYKNQRVEFHPNFNFIFGKNAQGKTNLLEAIYYLGYLKSFRTSTRDHLLLQGEETGVLEAVLNESPVSHAIRIVLEAKKNHPVVSHQVVREVWLNQKKPQLFRDYYGLVPVILFEPGEAWLFRESPSQRRKFINQAVFLDYPASLKNLKRYDEVLAQKNRILLRSAYKSDALIRMKRAEEYHPDMRDSVKEGGGPATLEVWNEQLARLGAGIIRQRVEWIEKMNEVIEEEYRNLSRGKEEVRIVYHSSVTRGENVEEEIFQALQTLIREKEMEEKRRGESIVGPHRDDFSLTVDGRSVGSLGSQGENRSAVIALKLSQIKLYEKEYQKSPIFLLDDVASELDEGRVEGLFLYLQTTSGQVFITATEKSKFSNDFKQKGAYFLVEGGNVRVLG